MFISVFWSQSVAITKVLNEKVHRYPFLKLITSWRPLKEFKFISTRFLLWRFRISYNFRFAIMLLLHINTYFVTVYICDFGSKRRWILHITTMYCLHWCVSFSILIYYNVQAFCITLIGRLAVGQQIWWILHLYLLVAFILDWSFDSR